MMMTTMSVSETLVCELKVKVSCEGAFGLSLVRETEETVESNTITATQVILVWYW